MRDMQSKELSHLRDQELREAAARLTASYQSQKTATRIKTHLDGIRNGFQHHLPVLDAKLLKLRVKAWYGSLY